VREVPLAEVKDDLSRNLREVERGEIVITRHGKPAGVLIGFRSEDDWFDYKLENDPRFLRASRKPAGAFARVVVLATKTWIGLCWRRVFPNRLRPG
jgi:prevent-host-death family protein